MLKLAGLAAVALALVFSSIESRADCPDGYCSDGTVLEGVIQQRRQQDAQQARERQQQCIASCEQGWCRMGRTSQCTSCMRSCR